MPATDATAIPESRAPQQPAPGPPRRRTRKITVGSVRARVEERAGRSAPPPPGPADWRDRAKVLATTTGPLSRAAVRRGRRKLGRVG